MILQPTANPQPIIHPANACTAQIRHRTAVQMAYQLCQKGITNEANILAYIRAALPAHGLKPMQGIAKEMANQYSI